MIATTESTVTTVTLTMSLEEARRLRALIYAAKDRPDMGLAFPLTPAENATARVAYGQLTQATSPDSRG